MSQLLCRLPSASLIKAYPEGCVEEQIGMAEVVGAASPNCAKEVLGDSGSTPGVVSFSAVYVFCAPCLVVADLSHPIARI